MAMMASPMNLSKVPWLLKMTSDMALKYSFNKLTIVSTGSFSVRVVNPRISQNRIDTLFFWPPKAKLSVLLTTISSTILGER